MIIKDLYKKKIDRTLNPAVSAEDFSVETVKTEISEYVFTDEIINGLFNVLNAIRIQQVSHNGIWINGYFGSGKSHFLKYLSYCINPAYREDALNRLTEAVKERDPLTNSDSKSEVTIDDIRQLSEWIRKATVDLVLFNIGAVHDSNGDGENEFTSVFWKQFNRFRGYNSFNLALAQNFEKVLDQEGKFDEFKRILAEEKGYDWNEQADMLASFYLDLVLEVGKELLPALTIDAVRQVIIEGRQNISPEAFCRELKEYIAAKNDKNYRLLILVDEVSQFIANRERLLLQLQEVVTGLHNHCNSQAWVACTAQQDLSQLLDNIGIVKTSKDYGKIMGRFEVRVSLKGDQTEHITQKRLLDKTDDATLELEKLWDSKHLAIEDQFTLPSSFYAFRSEEDFVDYYPFVPYQFRLIIKVLDSFGALRYIDSQSRGNSRSLIKITHSTAVKNMNDEVGKFISFDRFYNSMFEGSLMASGQRAISNANKMIREYNDAEFAQRVVNVLFMICNLTSSEKLLFPATLDHIVTLLMEDVDTNKAELINRVESTLAFLLQKHIIRTEKFDNNDVYCFQSEDEIDAAREIDAIPVDQATFATHFSEIFKKHFKCGPTSNKETYISRSFSIGWTIYGRNFYSNNADIIVDFALNKQSQSVLLFDSNEPNKLTFNLSEEFGKDKLLLNNINWYCQVQQFATMKVTSDTRRATVETISARARKLYDTEIVPKIGAILNRCEVMSGSAVMQVEGDGSQRYKNALNAHFDNVYAYAKLAVGEEVPTSAGELAQRIQRAVQPSEYGPLNPLSPSEQEVEQYLNQHIGAICVSDVVQHFVARPYGWADVVTLYFLNELRRRGRWSFKYYGSANIDNKIISANILREQNKFTIVHATAISQELINQFVAAWKAVLNIPNAPATNDSGELFRKCRITEAGEKHVSLGSIKDSYNALRQKIGTLPFVGVVDEAIQLIEKWLTQCDHQKFFEGIIADKEEGGKVFDRCKDVSSFTHDHLNGYIKIRDFVTQNHDNFEFLDAQDKVEALSAIISDPWPMPSMKQYSQLYRELAKALEEAKKAKKEAIRCEYQGVFDELKQICAENEVEYIINESARLTIVTNSDNLYVLDRNLSTSDYRAAQVEEIMKRSQRSKRTVRMVSLKTGSIKPINTEKDVDEYLAQIKSQLLEKLKTKKDNEDIFVK